MRARTRFTLFPVLCLLVLLSLILGALPGAAAPGPEYQQIIGSVTWSGGSSIDTDVVVTAGATLFIDSTALVYASNYEHGVAYPGGLNPNKIEIIVESGGYLQIETGAQLIANAPGDWYGIVFLPGSGGFLDSPLIRNGMVGVTIHDASPTLLGCTIRDMRGFSPSLPYGSKGGMAAGIVISGTSSPQVVYNIITNIDGGDGAPGMDGAAGLPGGGDGGDGTVGGVGGEAIGIYIDNGASPVVRGNDISDLTGGSGGAGGQGGTATGGYFINPPGGSGGVGGDGGPGGLAAGINVEAGVPAACEVVSNTISGVVGGAGGIAGNGGGAGSGWDCGTLLAPEAAAPGGNGGGGGSGGGGGNGGDAGGILINTSSPSVRGNTISGWVTGGPSTDGGAGAPGGWGGYGCSGSGSDDGGAGGSGGNGGYGGPGGWGGYAHGIKAWICPAADIRHNAIAAQVSGGASSTGGYGGDGGYGGYGGAGGEGIGVPSGNGGPGGDGGLGGDGGAAVPGGSAFGLLAYYGDPILARNSVTSLLGGAGSALGGAGGYGGYGGGGGGGGSGAQPGAGGNGGTGGAGGTGGMGASSGNALGLWSVGDQRLENNLLHSFAGSAGSAAGAGGGGGNGGDGGDAGNANAPAGNGGNGGNGGVGGNGGSAGKSYGVTLNGNAELVNNTLNNMGTNIQPGAGGNGGGAGLGGNAGAIGLPGTPGSSGSLGSAGLSGDEGSAYGIYLQGGQPTIVNNIVTVTGVGQVYGGPATSYGIFSSVGPLTLALDYNDVWGWQDGNYFDVTAGGHDISQDPLFADFNARNYRLQAGSPCRDKGTSSYSGLTLPSDDLDGNSRPQGTAHDMGAYEYSGGGATHWVYLPIVAKHSAP